MRHNGHGVLTDPVDLRATMRNFATGVAIATTYCDGVDGRVHDAVTVNSLSSLSLHPPLASICLRRDSGFADVLARTGVWAVSILDGGSHGLARLFAGNRVGRAAALATVPTYPGPQTGALLLEAPGWLECELDSAYAVGDHTLFVGAVVGAGTRAATGRLVFLHGDYHILDHSRHFRSGDST